MPEELGACSSTSTSTRPAPFRLGPTDPVRPGQTGHVGAEAILLVDHREDYSPLLTHHSVSEFKSKHNRVRAPPNKNQPGLFELVVKNLKQAGLCKQIFCFSKAAKVCLPAKPNSLFFFCFKYKITTYFTKQPTLKKHRTICQVS